VDNVAFLWIVQFRHSLRSDFLPSVPDATGADMTILREIAGESKGGNEATSTLSSPRLFREPRAPVAILSFAKRNALVACFNAAALTKKNGAWHGPPDGKPTSGVTIADLARDGLLTLSTDSRVISARLTEQGAWFARTLVCEADTDMPRKATGIKELKNWDPVDAGRFHDDR
jgi:hypothetical protein